MCVFVHGLDYQGRVFFWAVSPCRSFLVCQHVKEHRQSSFDDAKLRRIKKRKALYRGYSRPYIGVRCADYQRVTISS